MVFVRTHLVASVIGAVVLMLGGYLIFSATRPHAYATATVTRGAIQEEVLASGHVESPTVAGLSFKGSGKLVALPVYVGQHVAAGDVLARQDTSILSAQLSQAQAQVNAATAVLTKLQTGATPQAIAVAQASVNAAQLALANAYGTVATTLSDAQTKGNDAVVNQLARFFTDAQTDNPKLTFLVSDFGLANRIVAERATANSELAAWQKETVPPVSATAALDAALASADAHLGALLALGNDAVAAVAASSGLSTTDAATYRTSAATGLAELQAARTEIETLIHAIAADKSAVASTQANLNLTTASSTASDISAQQATVAAAQANVSAVEAQMSDLSIVSPFSGVVTDTTGSLGEIVGPATTVVSLMPDARLEVKANVSEDNIVNVKVGDPASIELDAFSDTSGFPGHVSAIDPSETNEGGAVYYQTTLLFDTLPAGVRSGMTANVWIETASSTDALIVPASALSATGTTTTVEVLEHGAPITRAVTTGIKSQTGMVQILSGLSEGETVVTGT